MVNPNATHWEHKDPWGGTGGRRDNADFHAWSDGTGFILTGRVLDIGCGTGRFAALCNDWIGVDITPSYVAYARAQGLDARLTVTPDDMPDGPFDRIIMASVLTHMGHADRLAYLPEIRRRLDGEALLDILPGAHDAGNVGAWYCDPATFAADLRTAGFTVIATLDWTAHDRHLHRYYRVR